MVIQMILKPSFVWHLKQLKGEEKVAVFLNNWNLTIIISLSEAILWLKCIYKKSMHQLSWSFMNAVSWNFFPCWDPWIYLTTALVRLMLCTCNCASLAMKISSIQQISSSLVLTFDLVILIYNRLQKCPRLFGPKMALRYRRTLSRDATRWRNDDLHERHLSYHTWDIHCVPCTGYL